MTFDNIKIFPPVVLLKKKEKKEFCLILFIIKDILKSQRGNLSA